MLAIRDWLSSYRAGWISGDLVAGLAVSAATIPAALAYAELAGLPAVYGLYASVVPAFAYAVFGSSRQLQIGPGSTLSILVASSLGGALIYSDPGEAVTGAALLALMAGALLLVAGLLRLGFLADFLSGPVLAGFTTAAALTIIASQLPKLLGIEVEADSFLETLWEVVTSFGETNGPTLVLGGTAILLLLALQRWLPRLPASLIAVALGILITSALELQADGVAVVGPVPAGLPGLEVPDLSGIKALSGAAAAVALLVYIETIAVSREFAARHGYEVDPNQELVASGSANLSAGLFQGFPVDASFSQSALNDSAGAHTQLAGVVTAVAVAVVLVGMTGLLTDLPTAVLAAIIVVAVLSLIKPRDLRRLWRLQRRPRERAVWLAARLDLLSAAVTFGGTLVLGILDGILIGVGFTLVALLQRAARPKIAVLGLVPGEQTFRDVARAPDAEVVDGLVIVRWAGELFFANATHFRDQVTARLEQLEAPRALLLDASAITSIDVTAADAIEDLCRDLDQRGLVVLAARARGPLRDMIASAELDEVIPPEHTFGSVREAVDFYRAELEPA